MRIKPTLSSAHLPSEGSGSTEDTYDAKIMCLGSKFRLGNLELPFFLKVLSTSVIVQRLWR